MIRRFLLAFGTLALALASAKTYDLTLLKPTVVAGQELKAGDYKIAVDDTKVVLTKGKITVETSVKVEKAGSKFSTTTVRYAVDGGKFRVEEIHLGGTNLRLLFN